MQKVETPDLVQGLINKDRKSFDILYHNYSSALYGVALRITRINEVAEDVLQESFVKVYKNIHKYDSSRGTLFTWMLNICRNSAIDKIRYGRKVKNVPFDSLDLDISTETNPEIELANSELWTLLDKLDDEHKEVLKLSYYFGYSHKEISEILEIPFGTVKSKIRIAIRELRKIYP